MEADLAPYPGSEVVGTIDRPGAGVTGLAEGDRVVSMAGAGCAEYAVVPASQVFAIADGLSMEAAGGVQVNYQTAYHGLHHRGRLKSGETLLITGASGGVGVATKSSCIVKMRRYIARQSFNSLLKEF